MAWPGPASSVTRAVIGAGPALARTNAPPLPSAPSAGTPGQNHVLVSAAPEGTAGIQGARVVANAAGSGAGVSPATATKAPAAATVTASIGSRRTDHPGRPSSVARFLRGEQLVDPAEKPVRSGSGRASVGVEIDQRLAAGRLAPERGWDRRVGWRRAAQPTHSAACTSSQSVRPSGWANRSDADPAGADVEGGRRRRTPTRPATSSPPICSSPSVVERRAEVDDAGRHVGVGSTAGVSSTSTSVGVAADVSTATSPSRSSVGRRLGQRRPRGRPWSGWRRGSRRGRSPGALSRPRRGRAAPPSGGEQPAGAGSGSAAVEVAPSISGTTT